MLQRESKDVIEIIRQFVSMLRFIAELPETLQQLAGREKEKLERELQKLLRLVEEFKEAIRNFVMSLARLGECVVGAPSIMVYLLFDSSLFVFLSPCLSRAAVSCFILTVALTSSDCTHTPATPLLHLMNDHR